MATKLTDAERAAALEELAGWEPVEGRDAITRTFKFKTFNEAFGFMSRVALGAETRTTIPSGSTSTTRLEVTLSTHDAGGLTELDVKMAKSMNAYAGG